MRREDMTDLLALVAVARERSFTRAAAQMGVSQSALSQTIRGLEDRLGIRLLTRTTRSVSTTEAGERLIKAAAPRLEEIESELAALSDLRDKPAGTVRITCSENAADTVVWPKLAAGLAGFPDIKVELYIDHGFTDIAAERFDAGVRLGESLEKDMIAVRIGPDVRLVPVGSAGYFSRTPRPETPQDLIRHNCINLRLATLGGLYAWEFEKDGRAQRVRVDGQLTFNTIRSLVTAAIAGYGIAFVPEDSVSEHIAKGTLIEVLGEWCPPTSGFHLYYPSRRQNSPAFQTVVDLLRHRK
ncbi:LysR substrate-binding domain-containing protein [Mesorhizobium sp. GbtcB19]|uniref:LysR substrate-binding domain-containing protein n=1 Tax=Mesorhizobium sp. GbtcB19 TaxID=2824764 RepID=UPI001C2FA5F0|nr:LysR substrate-binding domain-containing protein [Mesorhizobium sp. GbtcB19]